MKKIIALDLLCMFLTFFSLSGCSNDTVTNGPGGQEYRINVFNYSDNHYFLDTSYKSNFKDFEANGFLSSPENIARQVSTNNFEVWMQTSNTTADRKNASILIDLPPLPSGGSYDTSYYRPSVVQGKRYFGIFRKLSPSEYIVNYQAGYVSFKTNIQDMDYIGVTYKESGTGRTYGTNSVEFTGDTLVLKMIKAGNINPQTDTLAWTMKMKNIYRLPFSNVQQNSFEFKLYYVSPLTLIASAYLPGDGPLIDAMGLGQYTPPDYMVFNYLPGRTIIPETGDIIFPSLEPFYSTILNASGGDTSLVFKDLYTKLKTEASLSPKGNLYLMGGRITSGSWH